MSSGLSASEPLPARLHHGLRGWRGVRAVTMLTIYLVLLFAVPSSATINALGSLGKPSTLWGVIMLLWWIVAKLQIRSVEVRLVRQPVRVVYFALVVIAFISFAVAMMRGQPEDQVSPAFTALIRLLSWAGVLLITLDGVRTMNDVVRMVRRIGIGAGLLAALGIAQFVTKNSLIGFFGSIPGISMGDGGVAERGGVARVPGTAIHPLEYATALNAALPLIIAAAVSHGFHWQKTRGRFAWWVPVILIALSAFVGVSRSALIGFAVAVVTMIPVLPRSYRGLVIVGGAVLAVVAILAVPGLLQTTLNLFAGASNDPSTQSRTNGLDRAPDFISASPIVGAGFGTFLPRYYIFDNEWVLITVELGVLGVAAFAALFGSAIWSAYTARRRSTDPGVRLLGYALSASVVNIAVLFAFFDGLSFPQSGGIFFMIVGLCGAIRTVSAADAAHRRPRRKPRTLPGVSAAVRPPVDVTDLPHVGGGTAPAGSTRPSQQRATPVRGPDGAGAG